MITVKRHGKGVMREAQYKSLDVAMKHAAMVHEDGKGYTTTVTMADGRVVAEMYDNGEPVVRDERYVFVPTPTGDWRKRPTRYGVYKRL